LMDIMYLFSPLRLKIKVFALVLFFINKELNNEIFVNEFQSRHPESEVRG